MNYYVLALDTNTRRQIDPAKEDAFFRTVAELTGLDRAIAKPVLDSGRCIEHPLYRFSAEPINPFQPAKVVIP